MAQPPSGLPPRVALIGIMGSGKTTVGRHLARILGYDFVDMDAEIVRSSGSSIRRLFEVEGEAAFRRREADLLAALARRPRLVVATGGGVVLRAGNRRLLSTRFATIWLQASPARIWGRIAASSRRPLLDSSPGGNRTSARQSRSGAARHRTIARRRGSMYAASGRALRAGVRPPRELAEAIARRLERRKGDVA